MTKIEKLEAQILDYKKELAQLEAEIELLKSSNECKVDTFERVKSQEAFYNISLDGVTTIFKQFETEQFEDFNKDCFKNNNYFKSIERAVEVKSKIELLLKLERLYDTFCPDYKPNWNDNSELKHFIEFDCEDNVYVSSYTDAYYRTDVYFPSEDIARKVCDILNTELERNKENEAMS